MTTPRQGAGAPRSRRPGNPRAASHRPSQLYRPVGTFGARARAGHSTTGITPVRSAAPSRPAAQPRPAATPEQAAIGAQSDKPQSAKPQATSSHATAGTPAGPAWLELRSLGRLGPLSIPAVSIARAPELPVRLPRFALVPGQIFPPRIPRIRLRG
ncbi:hypothetical protein [Lolliginicoccus levis]|uniref:hypothetical protein n=1 Tax=Lolliginicoccus levis TaxID=2919542 RepID=UPI00241F47FB|nr:hypothetical protein [Lolliginicoccus levis]